MGRDRPAKSPRDRQQNVLVTGEIDLPRLVPSGSNDTFLVRVSQGDTAYRAVYKPRRGERPLRDFPSGTLYKREYAAYVVARAIGWDLIPLTVIRDGPFGPGSLQLWVDSEPRSSYFTLREESPGELERIAVFDCLANNADRKAGHCFKGRDGRVWSIDHGLTFHSYPKLRTVIWDFEMAAIPPHLLEDVADLLDTLTAREGLTEELSSLLEPVEVEALGHRLEDLLRSGRFPPHDPYRRDVPWPWF